jgi:branched-chain amino acid transport system substrate-binding protein
MDAINVIRAIRLKGAVKRSMSGALMAVTFVATTFFACLVCSPFLYAQQATKPAVANAPATVKPATLKIGLSGPFSGGSAPMGLSMREGVRIAVEEINTYLGGVLGKPIELIERDDEANPQKGTAIAEELTRKEKVIATIGIVNTGVGLASIDVYQKARVPIIVAVSTGTALTKKFAPPNAPENFIFRVAPRTDLETAFLINHIVEVEKITAIAILADATPYGEGGKTDLEKALEAKKLKPIAVERFKIGDTNMSEQLLRVQAAGAKVIVIYGIGPELAAVVKSRDAIKWKVPTYAGWTASMQNFGELAGKSAEGVLMPQTFIAQSTNQRHRAFVDAWIRRTEAKVIPSPMSAAQGYDAMRILYSALQTSSSDQGGRIKDALEQLSFPIEGVVTTHRAPFSSNDHDAISLNMLVMGVNRKGRAEFAFEEDANKSFALRRKQ